MPRGGYRPGSGPKKGTKYKPREKSSKPAKAKKVNSKPKQPPEIPQDIQDDAKKAQLTPLDYMIMVMNDDTAEKERRDRMAQVAAPYVHPRADIIGKKDEKKERAKAAAGGGRFAPSAPPQLKAVK